MDKAILDTLSYFASFSYPVTEDEIHRYVSRKISASSLSEQLRLLVRKKKIICFQIDVKPLFSPKTEKNVYVYTLPQYSIFFKKRVARQAFSLQLVQRTRRYIRVLSFIPWIEMVGISGSLSMYNAKQTDDIDLFIITSAQRMWVGRFISLCIAELLGVRRKRGVKYAPAKVCLNLFFDKSDMSIPTTKRSLYTAHELLQMKPLINKNNTYETILSKNIWVQKYFPNVNNNNKIPTGKYTKNNNFLFNTIEFIAKKLQLLFINRHKTNEYITDTQLWFFPKDFGEKMTILDEDNI